jgi:hypothetical protein
LASKTWHARTSETTQKPVASTTVNAGVNFAVVPNVLAVAALIRLGTLALKVGQRVNTLTLVLTIHFKVRAPILANVAFLPVPVRSAFAGPANKTVEASSSVKARNAVTAAVVNAPLTVFTLIACGTLALVLVKSVFAGCAVEANTSNAVVAVNNDIFLGLFQVKVVHVPRVTDRYIVGTIL